MSGTHETFSEFGDYVCPCSSSMYINLMGCEMSITPAGCRHVVHSTEHNMYCGAILRVAEFDRTCNRRREMPTDFSWEM